MQVYTTIPLPPGFGELPDSPQEQLTEKGWDCTVDLVVPWDLRDEILNEIVGNNKLYPHLWGRSDAYAQSGGSKPYQGQIAGYSGATDASAYVAAHLTIKYGRTHDNKNQKQGQNGVELFSESLNFTDQHLTLEPINYKWSHNGAQLNMPGPLTDQQVVLLVKGYEYTQTRYNQAAVPPQCFSWLGTCNKQSYTSPTWGIVMPAETMLFGAPNVTRKVVKDGENRFTITYKITGKYPGWNWFYNPKGDTLDENGAPTGKYTGAWERIYAADDAACADPVKIFPPVNWTGLFV